jgi:hypothetical protein
MAACDERGPTGAGLSPGGDVYRDYLIVNLDRRQYLDPAAFGDGPTPAAAGRTRGGVLAGLAVLLAEYDGGFRSTDPIIGSWAGCRVVIADYDAPLDDDSGRNQYLWASDGYLDVSRPVLRVLSGDPAVALLLRNRQAGRGGLVQMSVYEYATAEFEEDD